jgi:hypothetical protein
LFLPLFHPLILIRKDVSLQVVNHCTVSGVRMPAGRLFVFDPVVGRLRPSRPCLQGQGGRVAPFDLVECTTFHSGEAYISFF